jgi:hypothetical protein
VFRAGTRSLEKHANADISKIEQSQTNTLNARGLNLTAFRPATIQVIKAPFYWNRLTLDLLD